MRRLLLLLSVLLTAWAGRGLAIDSPGTIPLSVNLEKDPVNLVEPRYRAFVIAESNRFAFRVPPGYRVSGDPASGTLTLASRTGNGSITIAITGPPPADGAALNPDSLRDYLMRDYTNVVIAQEFRRDNAGGGGPGFDLQWKAAGLVECKRIVYLTSPIGVLRFTATSSRENFQVIQSELDMIILSFQISTNGTKPRLPPLLDRL